MIKEAINRILELAKVETITHEGRTFSSRPLTPMSPPHVAPLAVSTLKGVVDWILSEEGQDESLVVHILSPRRVEVISAIDPNWNSRQTFAISEAQQCGFQFGRDLEIEEFIIGIQINFQESPEKAELLKFVSHISKNEVRQATDDGISQSVMKKNEIGRHEAARIDPIQKLLPFRTFREIEQPVGEFLLRIKQGRGDLPTVALYSTAGAAWELEAIEGIHEYLKDALPGKTVIR